MIFKIFYFVFMLIISINSSLTFCAKTLTGNGENHQTFNFSIGSKDIFQDNDISKKFSIYIASNESKDGNNFAVALASRGESKFRPLVPEKVKLNNNPAQINPLNGAKIALMKLLNELPVIVKDGDKKVYVFSSIDPIELLSSDDLNDSQRIVIDNVVQKNPTSGIVKLATAYNSALRGSAVFAAIKSNTVGTFGTQGSGIAVITADSVGKKIKIKNEDGDTEEKDVALLSLKVLNADPADTTKEMNRAAPLTGQTPAIRINDDATIISDIVDMHWDNTLSRLYISLQVTSGNGVQSGARALISGRVTESKIFFDPIVSDAAVKGNNQIIGNLQPSSSIFIHKIKTLHTSTCLSYLIVNGGNGDASSTTNTIYALPLVNNKNETWPNPSTDKIHGTLAKFDQDPKDYFNGDFFSSRAFKEPAQAPGDLLTMNDQAAQVGGGALPLAPGNKISDMFVINDSVFVSIDKDYDISGTTPGMFYSQPIFNNKGVIKSWTQWQRVAGTDDKMFGGAIDIFTGQFWYTQGNTSDAVKNVKVTLWDNPAKNGLLGGTSNSSNVGLINITGSIFPDSTGGIFNFLDFAKTTPGLNSFSMFIATGLKKIMLVESGKIQDGFYKPTKGDFSTGSQMSFDGSMPATLPETKLVSILGGQLNNIGQVTTAQIITDTNSNQSWIIVGGVSGTAILTDDNGIGWQGNIASLNNIPAGLKFKIIGNYNYVQKILSDGKFLYILTNTKLDRIEISADNFKTNNLNPVTLATSEDLGILFDLAISGKFALLGTGDGLFRVGNSSDITSAANNKDINWTSVTVPESAGPVSKLILISPTGNISDFAQKGQVYVLSSYRGLHKARINRFFVDLSGDIGDSTIVPLPDLFSKKSLSNFIDFGRFRDYFFTDGALLFSLSSKDVNVNLFLHLLSPGIKSGTKFFTMSELVIPINAGNSTQIGNLVRSSASGSLVSFGSFGYLRVNE